MFEKIRKLKYKDVDDAVNVWCNALIDNEYYKNFFNDNKVSDELYFKYKRCVEACIMRGYSYGCFKGKTLIAVLIAADYSKIQEQDDGLFYDLFEGETEYLCKMNEFVQAKEGDKHFIIAICTEERFRGKGFAHQLLTEYFQELPKPTLVCTDCIEEAHTLFTQFDFVVEQVALSDSCFLIGTKEVR